jgi:hypothetical protein
LADSLLDLLEAALDARPDLHPLFGHQLFDIERLASLDANLRETGSTAAAPVGGLRESTKFK